MVTDLNYKMWNRLGSRKWIITLLGLILAIGFRAVGWTDNQGLVDLVKYVIGLYMGINIGEGLIKAISETMSIKLEKKDAAP
jgi:Na+/pantothenate symporter